ncbi:hypothetical protein [Mesonia algae]|uniref:hypothetical protein n=1 Tax=Mesonia algae TaxID=213248 RepID=UPI001475CA6C|nr:hypothetical protein [Mesonia algae]
MNKYYLDIFAIIFLTGFAILAYSLGWWQNYSAFVLIPLLGAYFLGKEIAKKQEK